MNLDFKWNVWEDHKPEDGAVIYVITEAGTQYKARFDNARFLIEGDPKSSFLKPAFWIYPYQAQEN